MMPAASSASVQAEPVRVARPGHRPSSTPPAIGTAIIQPSDVRYAIVCQKLAPSAPERSGTAPSRPAEGLGHLAVDPVEVLLRLGLHGLEGCELLTDLLLQL